MNANMLPNIYVGLIPTVKNNRQSGVFPKTASRGKEVAPEMSKALNTPSSHLEHVQSTSHR